MGTAICLPRAQRHPQLSSSGPSGQCGIRCGVRGGMGRVGSGDGQRTAAGVQPILLPVRMRVGILRLPTHVGGVVNIDAALDPVGCSLGRYHLDHRRICLGMSGKRRLHRAGRTKGKTILGHLSRILLLYIFGVVDSVVLDVWAPRIMTLWDSNE